MKFITGSLNVANGVEAEEVFSTAADNANETRVALSMDRGYRIPAKRLFGKLRPRRHPRQLRLSEVKYRAEPFGPYARFAYLTWSLDHKPTATRAHPLA